MELLISEIFSPKSVSPLIFINLWLVSFRNFNQYLPVTPFRWKSVSMKTPHKSSSLTIDMGLKLFLISIYHPKQEDLIICCFFLLFLLISFINGSKDLQSLIFFWNLIWFRMRISTSSSITNLYGIRHLNKCPSFKPSSNMITSSNCKDLPQVASHEHLIVE